MQCEATKCLGNRVRFQLLRAMHPIITLIIIPSYTYMLMNKNSVYFLPKTIYKCYNKTSNELVVNCIIRITIFNIQLKRSPE